MIEKTKMGLITLSILTVILATSTLWLYTETDDLQTQINNLQSRIDLLNATYQNYMKTHSHNNSEYDTLRIELTNLLSELNNLRFKYDSYIANHQYTDEEYKDGRFLFYYVKPQKQKFGVYNLSDELNGLEWIHPYQEGVFDCSEMSAYLERHLENEGWHTMIVAGPFGSRYHAWLLVETSVGHYMPVESTNIQIVWWSNPNFNKYFIYDYQFETIQDAVAYNESEFDWWKT